MNIHMIYMRTDTGLTRDQFLDLFKRLPSLRIRFQNDSKKAYDSLYMYLMKIRTGRTNDDIAQVFHITGMTVGRRLKEVRAAFEEDFVFQNVNTVLRSRVDLAAHTTALSQMLF